MKSGRRGTQADRRTAALFVECEDLQPERIAPALAERIHSATATVGAWTAGALAGVDEAGLGPLLGPLTIGFSSFKVPHARHDLWPALETACTDNVDDDHERLVVADSKEVFTRTPRGERRLERTALAFLASRHGRGQCAASARAALDWMARDLGVSADLQAQQPGRPAGAVEAEPWSEHLERSLPLHDGRDAIELAAAKLGDALSRAGIELTGAGVRIVSARALNASFAETSNKSLTHWLATRAVLTHLWGAHASEGLDLAVDRHGGRMRYAPLLAEAFPHCAVHIVSETPPRSEYILLEHSRPDDLASTHAGTGTQPSSLPDQPARRMRIHFAERAESTSFAVALASCLAKHARETCMNAFNAYFGSLQPGLLPTAGYVTDGRRWLEDAQPAIERAGIARGDLVRAR